MANKTMRRIVDFTEEHPIFTILMALSLFVPTLIFVLALLYDLIFVSWLGL